MFHVRFLSESYEQTSDTCDSWSEFYNKQQKNVFFSSYFVSLFIRSAAYK